MWMAIIFFIGMLVFLSLAIFAKLYKFKGTKLKNKDEFCIGTEFILYLVLSLAESRQHPDYQ